MKRKKRRKNRKAEVHVPFPLALANGLVLVAVFGLSYVWLCARCEQLGQDIKQLETSQRETRRRLISEQERWASRLAPANFQRTLGQHRLAMRMPEDHQIIRVRTHSADSPGPVLVHSR